ncbi:MAG: hypothetical protein BWY06_03143 [Candidatus Latescibacteria bacterium ADurb.Bin168]|nr:MAG: hypothetical protein BWY06_03143 [Candidatus Latescibacteria bacterium ADurb.Bin168]
MANGHVDAENVLPFLIDDRVNRQRGFPCLPVTDDEFPLSPADRRHRINRLEPGLERRFDRLTLNNTGSLAFDEIIPVGNDVAFAVERVSQRINGPPQKRFAHRNLQNTLRPLCRVAFLDFSGFTEKDAPDVVFFQVERQTHNSVRELHQFSGHYVGKPVYAGDAIPNLKHRSRLVHINTAFKSGKLLRQYLGHFIRTHVEGYRHRVSFSFPCCNRKSSLCLVSVSTPDVQEVRTAGRRLLCRSWERIWASCALNDASNTVSPTRTTNPAPRSGSSRVTIVTFLPVRPSSA